jgi:hypothetical protein
MDVLKRSLAAERPTKRSPKPSASARRTFADQAVIAIDSQAAPMAERGKPKSPEGHQLNYRLTTNLHKRKVCDTPRPIL